MTPDQRDELIRRLQQGEEISPEWARILFPPEKREYELVYHGKDREEDVLADTLSVPLQPVRTFAQNGVDWQNMLIFGDNLQVMKSLLELKKRGKLCNADGTPGVRLVYIDPPFATKREFRGSQDQQAYLDKIAQDLNMYVEEIKPGFPDCIGRRFNGKGWERVRIEFEFQSSNFKLHKHDPKACDLVICWEHDWADCPLEVMSLKDIIPGLPNPKVSRPDAANDLKQEGDLEKFVAGIDPNVRACYQIADQAARGLADEVWAKINGKDTVSYYSPKRVFCYLKFRKKKGVRLTLFTRGEPLSGVKQFDFESGGAKWGVFTLTGDKQAAQTAKILGESFKRIKAAIDANENTGWYAEVEPADDESEEESGSAAQ